RRLFVWYPLLYPSPDHGIIKMYIQRTRFCVQPIFPQKGCCTMKENVSRPARSRLHRTEERLKYILREQVAELASLLEVVISVLVLLGLLISAVPVAREMLSLWSSGSTDAFQTFLGHAFN